MSYKVVIPARYASERLPGKPLLEIQGKPMLQLTWEKACSSSAEQVIIATDDARVAEAASKFGAECVMTAQSHRSGTERLHEVALVNNWPAETVVVNVQGDEPLIPPDAIDLVANNLQVNPQAGIATLCEKIVREQEHTDPNAVKVVFSRDGFAHYFSRACIPHAGASKHPDRYRHIGIYAYRVEILRQFISWPVSDQEATENLEQIRALDNGVKIHVDKWGETMPAGVDTPEDLEALRQLLRGAH